MFLKLGLGLGLILGLGLGLSLGLDLGLHFSGEFFTDNNVYALCYVAKVPVTGTIYTAKKQPAQQTYLFEKCLYIRLAV